MFLLCREELAADGNHTSQCFCNVVLGGAHYVEVVRARVGDDAVRSLDELRLGEPLEVGLERHALDDQCLGALSRGHADRLLLLDDVGAARAVNRHFAPVREDEPGHGPGGLGHAADSRLAKTRRDQSSDARFAAGAVDVNSNWNSTKAPPVQQPARATRGRSGRRSRTAR